MEISIEDPRTPDVDALLQKHSDFCHAVTPACGVHTLDLAKLRRPGITLFAARIQGDLVGVCALKMLSTTHAELKSMHVQSSSRGKGIARSLVSHILEFARSGGVEQVSLETGSNDEFAPARQLYSSLGFKNSGPFADYPDSSTSVFMSLTL
jgi:putative acetyltransferase